MSTVENVLSDRYKINTFMVKAAPGQNFGAQTLAGLGGMAVMVAFCSSQYGEKTGIGYETFEELKFAHENDIPIIPVKLCNVYPPQPQKPAACAKKYCPAPFSNMLPPERDDEGCGQNSFVLRNSLVYIDGLTQDGQYIPPADLARKIYESLNKNGFIQQVSLMSFDPKPRTSCTIS